MDGLKKLFLIHGEKDKAGVLQEAIGEKLHKKAHIVERDEVIYLL